MSGRAIVAARRADGRPDTAEIRALAAAVGYEVVAEATQRRHEDPTYAVGRGKAEALMRAAGEHDADAVVYDGELSPGQTAALAELLPDGVDVLDRPRLALRRFAEAAGTRAAEAELERARLRYRLPRLRERIARDGAGEDRRPDEADPRVRDVERRIRSLEATLDEVADERRARRARRREEGFDLVAIVGYANAGKSTLLRRLADDMDVSAGDRHADLDASATSSERPFETVGTTTRRATVGGRRLLLTDTVGFVAGVPHDAIRSFRTTTAAARDADAVLLAVDATDDPADVRSKVGVALAAVEEPGGPVLPVLTRADECDPAAIDGARRAVEAAPEEAGGDGTDAPADAPRIADPVAVSAREGQGVDGLRRRLGELLPAASATLRMPNADGAQAVLSWAHDRLAVEDVAYSDDGRRVSVAVAGRPEVVAEAERKADALESD